MIFRKISTGTDKLRDSKKVRIKWKLTKLMMLSSTKLSRSPMMSIRNWQS